jgi:DNA-binding MarR family transcriptional regulator
MQITALDPAVAGVAEALSTIVRQAHTPRWQEKLSAEARLALDRASYPILRRVAEGEALRLTEVAHALQLDVSTVSRQVKHLEVSGLIARRSDPSDGRAAALVLTPSGRDALDRLRAAHHRTIAQILDGWSPAERAALATGLARLAADFVAYGATP